MRLMSVNRPISVEQIKNTETYKKLSKMLQNMVRTSRNVVAINHGYLVSKNRSFEEYNNESTARYYNKEIIKELLENDTTN